MKRNFIRTLIVLSASLISEVAYGQFVPNQYLTVTPAGTGLSGLTTDGKAGYMTNVSAPKDVCVDIAENIYYTDQGNGRVRKISAADGTVSTVAGGGSSTAEGVPAISASLAPSYMCIDGSGNIYVSTNNRVRKIDATTGMIQTVAGTGAYGFSGDGLAATAATMNGILGICVDVAGNLYLVDSGNNRVRKVTAATGLISTIAGTGVGAYTGDSGPATAATLHWPTVIAVNSAGDVYVADQFFLYATSSQGMYIRKISASTGVITTVAGNSVFTFDNLFNVHPTDCFLGHVTGMCCDDGGAIYCNEISCSCRKIDFTRDSVYAVAGNFEIESYGDGISSLTAYMNYPYGICVDASGNLIVADELNNRIRRIIPLTHAPTFAYRQGQYIYPCTSQPVSINTQLAVAILDSAQLQTWTVVTPPVNGTLSGFPFVMLSKGTDSLTTPEGLTYTPATSYTGLDSFVVMVSNGTFTDYITVYASVAASSPVSILIPPSICTGAAFPLTASASGGTWSLSNGNTYMYLGNIYGFNNGLDTITYVTPGACAATEIMTVNVSPDAGLVSGAGLVCIGAHTTLAETVTGGTWSADASGTTTVDGSGVVTGLTVGTAVITYTVNDGTCVSTSTKTLTVGTPVSPFAGTTTRVCQGASLSFSESVGGGAWSLANGFESLSASGTTATVTGLTVGVDTLKYTVTNSCGSNSYSLPVTVNPVPSPSSLTGPSSVCQGAVAVFSVSDSGGTWNTYYGHATISGHSALSGSVTGIVSGYDTVYYTITNSAGCSAKTESVIFVNPLPDAGVISGLATEHTGSSVSLTESVGGGTWSTTNSLVTTVSLTGLVYGVAPGVDSIVYSVTDGTCPNQIYFPFTVTTIPTSVSYTTSGNELMSVMPNPTTSAFRVTIAAADNEVVTFTVTNVTGQIVKTFTGMTNEVVAASIDAPAGIYMLNAETSHSRFDQKLVVE